MKGIKKILALALAMVMAFGLTATNVFASGNDDTITINNAKEGETYKIYKLFDLVVDSDTTPTKYSYKVNSAWSELFTTGGALAKYVTITNGYVTEIKNEDGTKATDAADLAKAASGLASKPAENGTVTVAAGAKTAAFTGLEDGYYLITSTLGTIAMAETTPDASAVTINEKNPTDTIEKEVKEDSTNIYGEENDAQVGDTVEFRSKVKIVKGTRNVIVHDQMQNGLTYTAGSVAIAGLTKGTEYTVNESPADGDTFDIAFTQSWIDGLDFGTDGYKEYTITYTAVLNDAAIVSDETGVAIVDQINKTRVQFGDGTYSEWDETKTTTHKFEVLKYDGADTNKANLAGAVFKVKKDGTALKLIKIDEKNYRIAKANENGSVETFTTVADGNIVIWGVDADDDYALEETQAPSGYNKLAADVAVTVNAANTTRADVENNAGAELPSTGGIGTTIFYAIGSVLVVGAGVLLISKKRMFN